MQDYFFRKSLFRFFFDTFLLNVLRGFMMFTVLAILTSCINRPPTLELLDRDIKYKAQNLLKYKASILWVVDNSYSMQKYQELLLSEMDAFLDTLAQSGIDFHLGLTSTDMRSSSGTGGKFIGSPAVLNLRTGGWDSLFKERFVLGENGSNRERGLDSVHTLLTKEKHFVDTEAPLILIFLSDEEDSSLEDTSYYIDFLNGIKPPPNVRVKMGWQAHFFGVLTPEDRGPNCNGRDTQMTKLKVGTRYLDLVNASDGISVSICEGNFQFQSALSKIKKMLFHFFTDYKLDQLPIEETIRIYVNGNKLYKSEENGWMYHSDGNFIRFYGEAIPSYDEDIKIQFSPKSARL